jgi:3-dehydroquinate synthase
MEILNFKFDDTPNTLFIGKDLSNQISAMVKSIKPTKILLVVDKKLSKDQVDKIEKVLAEPYIYFMDGGEHCKTMEVALELYHYLVAHQYDRRAMIISLGGGSIGDVCGFVAATYYRGIKYAQIPTTLLAQVDASIGGKTAINFAGIKNIIGAFYQPLFVACDITFFESLSPREMCSGLAEIIRISLTHDAKFFAWLETNTEKILQKDFATLCFAIKRACELKAFVVQQDEKDLANIRALLNFGHTFGHALESCQGLGLLLHGEAVAIGICVAARLSVKLGYLDVQAFGRIEKLLKSVGLPISIPAEINVQAILTALQYDKKVLNQKSVFIILKDIGRGEVIFDINMDFVSEALEQTL